ncbi:MAG TPA: sialidase family protein [Candidatus Thermoplasmatota archaeon]|nr:sialidase family protein [Candidatus Thermoplasmatota archaeon]
MRVPIAVLLFAASLAVAPGCLDGPDDEGGAGGEGSANHAPVATFFVHDVGEQGPEPSIGVDSSGAIYFQALAKTMKSTDGGATWRNMNSPVSAPTTLDPYLWLDPVTDRIFANQLYVACSYLTFSDDGGEIWTPNPAACGTPVNDHQKMTTGPYVPGSPLDRRRPPTRASTPTSSTTASTASRTAASP